MPGRLRSEFFMAKKPARPYCRAGSAWFTLAVHSQNHIQKDLETAGNVGVDKILNPIKNRLNEAEDLIEILTNVWHTTSLLSAVFSHL
jgi:hypothetical protein